MKVSYRRFAQMHSLGEAQVLQLVCQGTLPHIKTEGLIFIESEDPEVRRQAQYAREERARLLRKSVAREKPAW